MGKDATVTSLTQENRRLQEESKLSARRSQLKQECREKRTSNASLQKQVSITCTESVYVRTYVHVCVPCTQHGYGDSVYIQLLNACMYMFGQGQCTCIINQGLVL